MVAFARLNTTCPSFSLQKKNVNLLSTRLPKINPKEYGKEYIMKLYAYKGVIFGSLTS
jgi:hypothetical protein